MIPIEELKFDEHGLIPAVVQDAHTRQVLTLAYMNDESLKKTLETRETWFWSRSRGSLWHKGETSGNTQQLLRVDLDCDRDALRFTVRQHGAGFCHLERRACWPSEFALDDLERTVVARATSLPLADPDSRTGKLLGDPALLAAKLREEAAELAEAETRGAAVHETADLLYMALVALVRGGGSLTDVRAELARRHAGVTRRPMTAKPPADAP